MCPAHIGDDAIVGFCHLYQRLDVAWVTCPHLYHRYLVGLVQLQQCFWHTDVIVEVALSEPHIVLLFQHGSH